MPSRPLVAPVLAASLVALAGRSFAGDTPPLFQWASPVGGDWSDQSNWSPMGAPGLAGFYETDALVDIDNASTQQVSINDALYLRNLTVRGVTELLIDEQVYLSGDLRLESGSIQILTQPARIELEGSAYFAPGTNVTVQASTQIALEGLFHNHGAISAQGWLKLAPASIEAPNLNTGSMTVDRIGAGHFRNEGTMLVRVGAFLSRSFINTGTLRMAGDYTNGAYTPEFGETLENHGELLVDANILRLAADRFLHDGAFTALSDEATVTFTRGDHHFTENAFFDPLLTLVFDTTSYAQSVTSGLSTGADVEFQAGFWAFEGALDLTGSARFITDDRLHFGDDVRVAHAEIQSDRIELASGITSTNSLFIEGRESTSIAGPVHLSGQSRFMGGTLDILSGDLIAAGTVTFDGVVATLASDLHVDGDLIVTGATSLVTPGMQATATDDITWSTPSLDLNVVLSANDEIIVGARRLNASITARRIRIGAGTSELNADLFVDDDVLIAGTSLSIGAIGEIAQRTIHGDLTTTYAPSQAWDFDILGSGARGIAESDTLVIDGDAAIYGILRVRTIGDASTLRPGDEFTLFTADSIDALFRFVSLPTLTGGLSFDLVYESSESSAIRLVVVPAPGAGACLALGIAGLAARRRRWLLAES